MACTISAQCCWERLPCSRRVLWAAPARAALGRRCGRAPHRLLLSYQWWRNSGYSMGYTEVTASLVTTLKTNRQPCPSLSMQQLFPNADRKVVPILPYGPHEAHRLIHVIRENTGQAFFFFFRGTDIPVSALIKQFPVVFTVRLQPAQIRPLPTITSVGHLIYFV